MRFPALPLLLLAAPASAQFGPFQEVGIGLASARDVKVVDFDGDSVLDVLSADLVTGQIVLYRGVGGGDFDTGRVLGGGPITTGTRGPTVFAVGDLDGDGDPDIAAQTDLGETVALRNLGAGTTGLPVPLDDVPGARSSFSLSISIEDMDGDGINDVVMSTGGPSSGASGGTWVQRSSPSFTFTPRERLFPTVLPGGRASFGDIDGDGDDDTLVLYSESSDINWIRNDGVLPRTVAINVTTGPGGSPLLDAELGDVDGDGDLDVVAVGSSFARAYLFENDGAGSFSAPIVAVPGGSTVGDLVIIDVEGDGDLDLVWARNPGGRRLQWAENVGGGTFGPVRNIDADFGYWRIQVADLDQDGVLDLVAQEPSETYWFKGSLAGPVPTFGPRARVDDSQPSRVVDLVITDYDGDSDLDVVGLERNFGSFSLIENLGEGVYASPVFALFGSTLPTAVRAADVDGDGDADLARLSSLPGPAILRENQGNFTFAPPRDIPGPGDVVRDLQFADLDGDGDQDAVTASSTGLQGFVSWAQNDGDGTFVSWTSIAGFSVVPVQVEVADMDGDGILDVIVADGGPQATIWWIRGLGGGAFAQIAVARPYGFYPIASFFSIADVNLDGRPDIVNARFSSSVHVVEWTENLGGGVFAATSTSILPIDLRWQRIVGTDLDADGDTDVLLYAPAPPSAPLSNARWIENLGASTWVLRDLPPVNTRVEAMAVGDLDCDGDVDLAVGPLLRNVGFFEGTTFGPIGAPSPCGPTVPNSTGVPGRVALVGTDEVAGNSVTLQAHDLPPNAPGFFLTSQTGGSTFPVPGSVGRLCLMGSIGRYVGPGQVLNSGPSGWFCLPIDLTAIPQPTGSVQATAGSTWFFQAWHRDVSGGGAVSNFTSAASVTFQ